MANLQLDQGLAEKELTLAFTKCSVAGLFICVSHGLITVFYGAIIAGLAQPAEHV